MYGQIPTNEDAWHFPARLVPDGVVDGDTLDVSCDLGFQTHREVRIRLLGVDTHEIYGSVSGTEEHQRGVEERNFVQDWLAEATTATATWPLRVYTLKEYGKYGRYLAAVVRELDEASLVENLRDEFDDIEYDP